METITATAALNELKLLDKRIQKKIYNACFITSKIGDKIKEDCDAEANLQSVNGLISRREVIKAALMKSNSTTLVKVSGEEMMVAAAIEKKSSISYLENLLETLRDQRRRTEQGIQRHNDEAQTRLDRLLESTFGKDLKARPTEITEISETFWKANEAKFEDVIQIKKKIEELDEYIDNFKNEVDLRLSEINSLTRIEIDI